MAKQSKRRRDGAPVASSAPATPSPSRPSAPAHNGATAAPSLPGYLPDMDRLGLMGLGALLLALLLAPIVGGLSVGYGDPGQHYLRLATFAAAALVPTLLSGGREKIAARALAVAAGWTVLSLLVHSRFLTDQTLLFAMVPATLDWIAFALVFLLAQRLGGDSRARLLLIGALLAGAAWVALAGAQEYGVERAGGRPEHRVMATFFAPNFTAGFLGLVLPLAVAQFLRARSLMGTVALGALAALATGVLAATGSRQGIAAALVGLAVALVLALACRVRLPWGRVGALLAAMALLAFLFRGPLTSRVTGNAAQAHSGEYRTETWKGSLAMAKAYPVLGAGPGTFEYRYPPFSPVAKTNLAHSSYLQVAAEQGFPALAVVAVGLLATLAAGVRGLRRDGDTDAVDDSLLRCALMGSLLVGVLRSLYDSEWSVPGNALPFWAVAGMVAAVPNAVAAAKGALAPRIAGGVGLLLSLVLLFPALALQDAQALMQSGDPAAAQARAESAAAGWPRDPDAVALLGRLQGEGGIERYREAARLEPSGIRFYQLARQYERAGQDSEAIGAFRLALAAEPTSLQTLRALAEAQERAGDREGALATWGLLAKLHEGPVGTIRAIPELVEMHPAFAYAALGDAAWDVKDRARAADLYARAAAVAEAYADMLPVYAQMEIQQSGANVLERQEALKALYARIMERRIAAAGGNADDLRGEQARVTEKLDARLAETRKLLGAPAGGQER